MLTRKLLSAALVTALTASTADAQQWVYPPCPQAQRPVSTPVYRPVLVRPVSPELPSVPAQPATTRSLATAPPAVVVADPYGFCAWLNGVRAGYRLAPVVYDPGMAAVSAANNAWQLRWGIGHWAVWPARRQNSGWGPGAPLAAIEAMWLSSPPHRAALLDPTVRFVGIAGAGAYWTCSLR